MNNDETIDALMASARIGRSAGRAEQRDQILKRIEALICFDALADDEGRCIHHRGKCYELGKLANELKEEIQDE